MLKMKKILVLGIAAILTLGLASCGKTSATSNSGSTSQTNHTHEYGGWTVTKPATLKADGEQEHTCACGENEKEIIPQLKYQRVDASGNPQDNGDYILFGFYPQSKVTEEAKITELTAKAGDKPTKDDSKDFISYKYYINSSNTTDFMWYKDIDIDDDKGFDYRCVYFDQYKPTYTHYRSSVDYSQQDDNGYETGNYYFFKYEPIKWRILNPTATDGKATILAELVLDSQDFNYTDSSQTIDGKTIYANNYEYSSIRKLLNDNFYNTAFNDLQKSIINEVEVDNSASTTGYGSNSYACANTTDNVFLLSYAEATNSDYGFSTNDTRLKQGTDYAKAQGLYATSDSKTNFWWLRSPNAYDDSFARNVSNDGNIIVSGGRLRHAGSGVVPALTITL